jgi:hypothetical protein
MNFSGHSMLIPIQSDPEWTDTTQILCDQPPGAPGVGAALIAMQALNLSPQQAAALVSSGQAAAAGGPAALSTAVSSALNLMGAANAQARSNGASVNGGHLPITISVDPTLQFLAGDPDRAFLLIQNNEAAGGGTLLISMDPIDTATPAYYLNFPPGGFGLLLDQNVINNPIYAGWAGTPAAGGVLWFGSRTNGLNRTAPVSGGITASTVSRLGYAAPSAGF